MKVVTIVGARPQFIKAAAVTRAIERFNRGLSPLGRLPSKKRVQEVLVHTGQHYDDLMDRVFFEELELPKPHHHLGVGSGSHARQTGLMLERIESVLTREKPEVVLVYGDTNSTLAGALAAVKLNIPLAHAEAGLRSYNREMPEEINRVLTDHLSTYLFCPTLHAVQNLSREGIRDRRRQVVKRVGDVMYDSVLFYSELAEKRSRILTSPELFSSSTERPTPNYILATLHRAENTDNPERLKTILRALSKVGKETPVILPLHPRTKKVMRTHGILPEGSGVRLVDPVSYFGMLRLEKNAKVILTDSGGVQKEAFWFQVPCVTLREETEWTETVESGWNVLVGARARRIVEEVRRAAGRRPSTKARGLFGDGKASEKIVQTLVRAL